MRCSSVSSTVSTSFWGQFLHLFLLIAIVLGWPLAAQAVVVDGLYLSQVPVASESEADRQPAMALAFAQVVVKVCGQQTAADNPRVQQTAKSAQQYVESFRYLGDAGTESLMLQVSFSPAAIQQVLREAQLPVWGENRPSILLWLATEQGGQRELLGTAIESTLTPAIEQQARQRGLPVLLPLMDLEDSQRVSVNDVWGMFPGPVEQVSQRYTHDALLLAQVRQNQGRWQGRWLLQMKDMQLSDQLSADSADAWSQQMIDQVTEALAARYAVAPKAAGGGFLQLQVSGIKSLADYAALGRYLNSLAPVRSAVPVEVQGDRILYQLDLNGDESQVRQYLALERRLTPELGSGKSEAQTLTVIQYRWTP